MSRARRFIGGLALTYSYQAITMIAGLVLTPLYLHTLGQHDYGLWLVATQLLTYLTLTDFGVVALLPQETAYATGRAGGSTHTEDLPDLVGQTVRLVLCQLPVVLVVTAAIWLALPARWQDLRGPLLVVMAGFVASFPLRILPALLQGLQDLSFTGAVQILNWALSTGVTVWMVVTGWNLYALAVGWLLSQTIITPIFIYRLRTRFPGVLPRRLGKMDWQRSRTRLGKGFWVSVAQVAQLLLANTDMLIIGEILGPAAVVPYACTGKLINVLSNQVNMLMHTATPGLCELKTEGSKQRLFDVLVALTQGVLTFSGLVFCILIVVNQWFVTWWVSAREYGGLWLTIALLINMLFSHWDMVAAYTVFCFDHQRRLSLTNLGNGIVTAGGALALTLAIGPIGAPIGSMAGTILVGLPFNLSRVAEDIGVTLPRLAWAMMGRWFWRFIICAAGAVWMARYWSPSTLAQALGCTAVVSAAYLAIMIPNVMRSPLGAYLRPALQQVSRKLRGVSETVAVG